MEQTADPAVAADMQRPLAVVDIDGVVADVRHRLHFLEQRPKDWKRFFAAADMDRPHPEGIELVRRLADGHEIVFLTGRPAHLRRATAAWLERNGLGGHRLEMRPGGDRRPAAVVKVEVLRSIAGTRPVGLVVDDDPVVIESMRAAGYPTLHARWESRSAVDEAALQQAQEAEGRT